MLVKNRHLARLGLVAILASVLIVACQNNLEQNFASQSPATEIENCRMVEHDTGETEICGQPQRVVALSPYILDMMLSLGVEPVGYSAADMSETMLRQSEFDNPDKQIPYLGQRLTTQPVNLGDRHSPSLEGLAQLQPDLILGEAWQGDQGKYQLLSQIAPTVLVDDQQGGWQRSIQTLAQALDQESELEQSKAAYEAAIAEARTQLSSVAAKYPQVLLISSGSLSQGINTYHCSEFSRLLESLGFQLVHLTNPSNCYSTLSLEVLPQTNADIIFVVAWDADDQGSARGWQKLQQAWQQTPILQQMPVTQAGRVYFIDAQLSTIRGPIAADIILQKYLEKLTPLAE
ncbi:MAG: ABC transporter substrate-binding protein [Elainellaceae cyanobacterium]